MEVGSNRTKRGAREAKLPVKLSSQHSHHPLCRLLELPRELRDEIYSWVLASTRITFGTKPGVCRSVVPTISKSRPHALALLRTCRHINTEIGMRWIGWVLFNFHSPEALLDVLTELPTTHVATVRHVRVTGRPIMLSLPHGGVYYRLAWTLNLVPHLQLDTLTVLGGNAISTFGGQELVDYTTLDEMIGYGTGWREFHYITPNSSILSFEKTERSGQTYLRRPQPEAWRSVLTLRDGPDSEPSVEIYRSHTISGTSELEHHKQDTFEQAVAAPHLEDFGLSQDQFLVLSSERWKETLVVAKRGRGADILENPKPPYDQSCDIRALAQNGSWSQLRVYFTETGDDDDEDIFGGVRPPNLTIRLDMYGCNACEINWADVGIIGGIQAQQEHDKLIRSVAGRTLSA